MNLRVLLLILAVAAAGCAGDSDDRKTAESASTTVTGGPAASAPSAPGAGGDPSTTTSAAGGTTSTTAAPSPAATGGSPGTTSPPAPAARTAASGAFIAGEGGAAVASEPGGPVVRRLRAGVVLAVDAVEGGWAHVLTPCENRVWVRTADGRMEKTVDIVIDPGHGGAEPGAVGPVTGLTEKDLNLAVARMTVEALTAEGITAQLARTGDYQQSLVARVAVASALQPKAFVSIHHNAAPDESWPKPGTETYYQVGKSVPPARSADSKRLSGLIYEEVVKVLSAYSAAWVADRDAGAKYRLGDSGDDYYGILRRSAAGGVVATLAELAFISNPSEEALLRQEAVQRAEAGAVARGITRWVRGEQPGDVFVVPYPRKEPAGGGGGTQGCVDPT